MYDDDIIAAIATGYMASAIGIIRVSGRGSFDLLEKIFTKKQPYKHRYIHYGHIVDKNLDIIDEVLVSIFKSPESYTGEDSFEINCHGGILVLNKVLQRVIEVGARLAQPGEFTKRAFLNGKLDLSQAEAVEKIISSKSERALKIAQRQLKGNFSTKLDSIREQILFLMAENEVLIDHPDEDLSSTPTLEKIDILKNIQNQLESILKASEFGHSIFEGVVLALVGKPNVGKSSLLNILTGLERSIVTDIPGTTRDVVSEQFNINGIPFTILDTAGIRKTSDIVENIGVERSKKAIQDADIVVAIFDATRELSIEDREIIKNIKNLNKKYIAVINKTDEKSLINESGLGLQNIINISCKTGKGIDELEKRLSEMASLGIVDDADVVSLNANQKNSLMMSINMCKQIINDVQDDIDPSLIAVDLMSMADYLDEIVGKITNEDMLDVMFKKFCIGK